MRTKIKSSIYSQRRTQRQPTLYRRNGSTTNYTGPDATLDFLQTLNDPRRWIKRPGVPIFKCHRRIDPTTGKEIVVDEVKLYEIARNLQRMQKQGVPIRMTLGHTEPTKAEPHQPPLAGFYVNARVAPFGPQQEPAIVADELLDPTHAQIRKNFPYRSSEYYDDDKSITGVALLARDPYLDLGVVSYSKSVKLPLNYQRRDGSFPVVYRYSMGDGRRRAYRQVRRPARYSRRGNTMPAPRQRPQPQPMHSWLPQYNQPLPPTSQTGLPIGTPYGYRPQPGTMYSAPWPRDGGSTYSPGQRIPHSHRDAPNPQTYADYAGPRGGPTGRMPMGPRSSGSARIGQRHVAASINPHIQSHMPRPATPMPGMRGSLHQAPRPTQSSRQPRYARYADELDEEEFGAGEDAGFEAGEEAGFAGGEMAGEEMMGGGMPMGGMGEDAGIESVLQNLEMAIEGLQEVLGGGEEFPEAGAEGLGPPNTPFPEEEVEEEEFPTPASRYRQNAQRPARYAEHPRYESHTPSPYSQLTHARQRDVRTDRGQHRYQNPENPMRYGSPSPSRVTYDRRLAQMNYELQQNSYALEQQRRVNELLLYERDQADLAACEAEISRLAGMGYLVDDYEVEELRRKPFHERGHYIAYIMDRIQKIGTEQLPPVLGDPTPGPTPDMSYPLTKEEMQEVLAITGNNRDPAHYKRAVEMVRYQRAQGGQGQAPIPQNRLPMQYQAPAPQYPAGPAYRPPAPEFDPYDSRAYQGLTHSAEYENQFAPGYGDVPPEQYQPTMYGQVPEPDPRQQGFDEYTPPPGSRLSRSPYPEGGMGGMDLSEFGQPNDNSGW